MISEAKGSNITLKRKQRKESISEGIPGVLKSIS